MDGHSPTNMDKAPKSYLPIVAAASAAVPKNNFWEKRVTDLTCEVHCKKSDVFLT